MGNCNGRGNNFSWQHQQRQSFFVDSLLNYAVFDQRVTQEEDAASTFPFEEGANNEFIPPEDDVANIEFEYGTVSVPLDAKIPGVHDE